MDAETYSDGGRMEVLPGHSDTGDHATDAIAHDDDSTISSDDAGALIEDERAVIEDEEDDLYGDNNDEENDEYWHERFRDRFFLLLVSALEAFRSETDFEGEQPFLTAWIVDSATFETHGKSWARRLNDSVVYDQYMKWREELDEGRPVR